jgi:hypothetical protein
MSKKKTVSEMAEEIYRNSKGLSVSELVSLVTQVMARNGDDPSDLVLRKQIGDVFRALMRNTA